MIPSRTVVQIRTHAQKYLQKLAKVGILTFSLSFLIYNDMRGVPQAGYTCNERGEIEAISAQQVSSSQVKSCGNIHGMRQPVFVQTSASTGEATRSTRRCVVNRRYADSETDGYITRSVTQGSSPRQTTPRGAAPPSLAGSSRHNTESTVSTISDHGSGLSVAGSESVRDSPGIDAGTAGELGVVQSHAVDASGEIIKIKVRRLHEAGLPEKEHVSNRL